MLKNHHKILIYLMISLLKNKNNLRKFLKIQLQNKRYILLEKFN